MAAVGTYSKTVDERIDKQDTTIQQMQGEMSQFRIDVQAMFQQMSDFTFKFSSMFDEWQRGQSRAPSPNQDHSDQEDVSAVSKGSTSMNMKSMRINVPRFEGGDPQG